MSAASDRILYEVRDRTARLTVNRPEKLNALDRLTMEAIDAAVGEAGRDPEVGVLVVTGQA
jgi:2-ketocyclohexanecarboxyl-CoA hydrolase